MGPKKGRRVRKIEVPNDNVSKFELRDTAVNIQWRRGRPKKGRRHSNGGKTSPGGRGRHEQRKHTHKRRELQKKGPVPKKVTQKQRLEESQSHGHLVIVTIQEGAHDQHLPDRPG